MKLQLGSYLNLILLVIILWLRDGSHYNLCLDCSIKVLQVVILPLTFQNRVGYEDLVQIREPSFLYFGLLIIKQVTTVASLEPLVLLLVVFHQQLVSKDKEVPITFLLTRFKEVASLFSLVIHIIRDWSIRGSLMLLDDLLVDSLGLIERDLQVDYVHLKRRLISLEPTMCL